MALRKRRLLPKSQGSPIPVISAEKDFAYSFNYVRDRSSGSGKVHYSKVDTAKSKQQQECRPKGHQLLLLI